MQKLPLSILFFFLSVFICQANKTDSLKKSIAGGAADTNAINSLNALTKIYWQTGVYDSAFVYVAQAKTLSEKLGFKKGIAAAYNNLGITYWRQGNYPEALKNYFSALRMAEELADKRKMGAICGNIGNIYINQGQLQDALKYELLSEKYATEKSDRKTLGNTYNSIANIYYRLAQKNANVGPVRDSLLELSLTTYQKAVTTNRQTENVVSLAHNYNNIGLIYGAQAKVLEANGDRNAARKKHAEANEMFLQSLKLVIETGDRESAAGSYINLGHVQTLLGQYSLAARYLDSALVISKEIGNLDDLKDTYFYLQVNDSAVGNYKSAYEHYKLFTSTRDSLLNEENIRSSEQARMNYEFDKKESLAKAEQERKDGLVAAEQKRQKMILFSVSVFGLLVLAFAVFAYRSFLQKKRANLEISRQKELVEEKQKEILDSIYYARRIQRSLLTNEHYILKALNRLRG